MHLSKITDIPSISPTSPRKNIELWSYFTEKSPTKGNFPRKPREKYPKQPGMPRFIFSEASPADILLILYDLRSVPTDTESDKYK